MADRVVDQVRDQALDESRIARRRRRVRRGANLEVAVCDRCLAGVQGLGGKSRKVDALALLGPGLAARECQQRLDHLLQVLLGREHALVGCAQRGEARLGVRERDLDQRSLACQRGAQLVRRVRGELALGLEGRFEPVKQVVEGVAEFFEFVLRAAEGKALVQARGGDPSGGAGDGSDRSQHPAGNEPAGHEGERGHDAQRDSGVDQELMRVGGTLRGLGGPCLGHLMDGLCQLMLDRRQLMLVLRQATLVLRQPRNGNRQLKRIARRSQIVCQRLQILCELPLGLSQLILVLCQLG